jgi:hypothetical protein
MTIGAVGSAGGSSIADLQQQLKQDMKTLAADQKAKADSKVIALDQARVQADQVAIQTATQTQAQATTQAADGSWYL